MRILEPPVRYLGGRELAMLAFVLAAVCLSLPDPVDLARRLTDDGLTEEARPILERRLADAQDPDVISAAYTELARLALDEGAVDRAFQHARAAVRASQGSIPARIRLAELEEAFCRPGDAAATLARADELYRAWRARGRPEAVRQARGVLKLEDELPTPAVLARRFDEWMLPHRVKLATYQRWAQQVEPALGTYRSLAADNPRDVASWLQIARLEGLMGREDASRRALARALELRPDAHDLRERLAYRYTWLRRPEQAAEEIQRAKLPFEEARERLLFGFVLAGRPLDGVGEWMRRFPGVANRVDVELELARLLHERGDSATCERLLGEVLRRNPREVRALERLGRVQLDAAQYAGAADTYRSLRRLDPSTLAHRKRLVEALGAAGREGEAARELAALVALDPADVALRRDLGLRFAWAGRHADALPHLRAAVASDPVDEQALYLLSQAAGETGNHAESARLLGKLLDLRGRPAVATVAAPAAVPQGPGDARRVLALYKRGESETESTSWIHTLLEVPLNYLGLVVEHRAVEDPLPDLTEMARYRGVVTWFHTEQLRGAERYVDWLTQQAEAGRRVVVMEKLGCLEDPVTKKLVPEEKLERLSRALGFELRFAWTSEPGVTRVISADSAMCEFERPLGREAQFFREVRSLDPRNRVYLKLGRRDEPGARSDAIFTGPRGGFCLESYAIHSDDESERNQWRLDPFTFLARALDLDGLPRMDFTTRTGARLIYNHVDGDGSNEPCRWLPMRSCAEAFLTHVLRRRDLPWTVSFIGCLVDPARHVPQRDLAAARDVLRDPRVEAAHHSYSHPFDWEKPEPGIALRDYPKVDMDTEVRGARRLVERLAGKPVDVMLWSGLANPTREVLRRAEAEGLVNFNGEGPRLDPNYPSIAHVTPIHRMVGGKLQHLSSAANDFAVTRRWQNPVASFRNVLHTFEAAEAPRRLLPVNVYIHFYLLATRAGARCLDDILDWVEARALHPITVSEFIRVTHGFRAATIERLAPDRWRIARYGRCLTVRFDGEARVPDLALSRRVLGWNRHHDALYVHLEPGDAAIVQLTTQPAGRPWLESSAAEVSRFEAGDGTVRLVLDGWGRRRVAVGGWAPGERVRAEHVPARGLASRVEHLVADAQGRVVTAVELAGARSLRMTRAR